MHVSARVTVAALATVSLSVALIPGASATPSSSASGPHPSRPWHRTLTTDVLFPFQLAVNKGDVWVADGATVTVSKVVAGHLVPVAHGLPGRGSDVAGLAVSADGASLAYTSSKADHSVTTLTIKTTGKADVVANLAAYEATANPDGGVRYGLRWDASTCAKDFIKMISGGPAAYHGIADSHPYAVASLGGGAWAVADAGGNDVLKVSATGAVSTLAVLPPQTTIFTKAMAAALGAPSCMVGESYNFEPVPTDVEVGSGGAMWVSSLPGGPEDPSLGARGSVYRIGKMGGAATKVAGGFLGATNLAIAPDGTLFVAELFAGKVTKIRPSGDRSTYVNLAAPSSIEASGGYAYVGTLAQIDGSGTVVAPGTIQRFRLPMSE